MSPQRQPRIEELVGMPGFAAPMVSAVWYRPSGGLTAGIPGEAVLQVQPYLIGRGCVLDRLSCEVTIVGTTGAVVRMGIWADDGSGGYPSKLILDAGTVDAVTSTGFKSLTISQYVRPGMYWIGSAVQGAAGTRPQLRASNFSFPNVGDPGATGSNANYACWSETGVSGAFGTTFTTTKAFQGAPPAIWIRAV